MFTNNPHDALVLAHERACHLRAEPAVDRLQRGPGTRRALAASLRRAANRLDPTPLVSRPA